MTARPGSAARPAATGDAASAGSDAAALERLLRGRRSCRAFLPDPVPEPVIRRMLAMAQETASWCNTQPWQVAVTLPPATQRLAGLLHARASAEMPAASDIPYPREYRGVYLQRRRETGFGLYSALGIAREDAAARARQSLENFRFFGAPHLALITTDEALGTYGAVDCGGYVATLLLAAQALGLGAVAQAAVARDSAFWHGELGIGPDRVVVGGVAFGWPDTADPASRYRPARATLDEAVAWVRE